MILRNNQLLQNKTNKTKICCSIFRIISGIFYNIRNSDKILEYNT